MPTFIIDGPDGSSYEVDAPEGASEAEVLQRVQAEASKAQPRPPRSGWQTVGDFLGDTIDNVLPHWGDEIAAIPDAAKALVKGQPVGEAFERGQADFKANQAQYDEEHPNLAWASTIGGMGAGLLLPAGNLARGASMGAKVLQGAKVGAAYGALSGAGEGDGLAERADSAFQSAVVGAGLGGLASPLLSGANGAHKWARAKVPGYDGATRRLRNVPRAVLQKKLLTRGDRAHEVADRMLADRFQEGRIATGMGQEGAAASPEAIRAEMERRQAVGVPAIPGDVTEALRNTTSWASRGMGPGQTMVRQRLDARKAEEAARVRQHVVDTMGPVVDPLQQLATMSANAKAAAAPGYKAAYAQPMVITPEIEATMRTPAFQKAVPHAVRNIRNAQRDPEALALLMRPDGTMDPQAARTLSTEGFDQVIRAMRDNGRDAATINPLTGHVTHNTNSVHINSRAKDLQSQLGDQNPAYRDVTERYADDMAQRDAFERGGKVQKVTGHELNDQFRHMPENAQGAWSIGARTALADEASTFGAQYPTGDTASRLRRALGDDVKQEAIGRATGNTGAVRGLQERLEAEHQGNILWKDVQGNSRTAHRQGLDADLDAVAGTAPPSGFGVRQLMGSAINFVANKANSQFKQDVKERIAQVVTETNPRTVEELMAQIASRAEHDKDFAALLHKSGIIAAKGFGQRIEPTRADGQVLLDIDEGPSGEAVPLYGRYEDNFDAEGNPL